MKKAFIIFLALLFFGIFISIKDIQNPSDSGDMNWLHYEITKYKANHGDMKSKWHLLAYYQYNDDFSRGEEIANLILEIIKYGYGGLKNGGDGIVVNLIDECRMGRLIQPKNVAEALELIKSKGGGLTELGLDIETRWQKGAFPGCPPLNISK